MITFRELKKNSKTRLRDAKILYRLRRYDSSLYLCGYAVEFALKTIICKQLDFRGVPSTSSEFEFVATMIKGMKTHNLEDLLKLSGDLVYAEVHADSAYRAAWLTVTKWDPEIRYSPIQGEVVKADAKEMINSTSTLLKYFWTTIK